MGNTSLHKPQPLWLEQLEMRLMLNASLSHQGLWSFRGSSKPGNFSDDILIQIDPDRPDHFQAIVNDQIVDTQALEDIQAIRIKGGKGDDTVTIDLPSEVGRITITIYGGRGNDILTGSNNQDTIFGGRGNDTSESCRLRGPFGRM